jgi:hypothetical protein
VAERPGVARARAQRWGVPLIATMLAALVAVGVTTQGWRPGHLAVYAACVVYAAATLWAAPRASRTRIAYLEASESDRLRTAKAAAVWAFALLGVVIGGLALIGWLVSALG